jgi:Flp pilus assembly protein TadD
MSGDLAALVEGGKLLARLGARGPAEAVLRMVLAHEPEQLDALLWLGAIVSNPQEALDLIGRAYTVAPTDPRAKAGLAWARARLQPEGPAEPLAPPVPEPLTPPLGRSSEHEPLPPQATTPLAEVQRAALLEQARQALEAGELNEALLAADAVARQEPRSLEALAILGVAYYRAGRAAEAERVYRRMLAIAPDHAEALANLGVLQLEAGRVEEAERAFRRALAADPTLDEVRLALADLLASQGRVDAAVAEWRLVADRNPAVLEFQVKIGAAYETAGRFEEAAAAYLRALDRHGDDPSLRLRLGRVLRAMGRTGAAVEQLREACCGPLATAECFVEFARALLEIGRLEEALRALDRALALAPDDPAALDLLARLQPPSRRTWMPLARQRKTPPAAPQLIGPSRGILEQLRRG